MGRHNLHERMGGGDAWRRFPPSLSSKNTNSKDIFLTGLTLNYTFRFVGDQLAVANLSTNTISVLNNAAAFIFLSLIERPHSARELSGLLAEFTVGIQREYTAYVSLLLEDLKIKGLAVVDPSGVWKIIEPFESELTALKYQQVEADFSDKPKLTTAWSCVIGDSYNSVQVEFSYDPDVALYAECARLAGMLSGMRTNVQSPLGAQLRFIFSSNDIQVRSKDASFRFSDALTASGYFFRSLLKELYPDATAYSLLHAGAVANRNGTILLPAVSGSGKTTLTGYLVANGWLYAGDDVVGVGRVGPREDMEILPLPTSLSVKEGSLPILVRYYSELETVEPVEYRAKTVRYAPVKQSLFVPNDVSFRRPRALVFPRYESNSACSLVAISELEALELLVDAGAGDGLGLGSGSFEILMDLISELPKYTLRYSNLSDAQKKLESICENVA